jgi:ABC-type transport system substrate-binding protein
MKQMTAILVGLAMLAMSFANVYAADDKPQYGGVLKMIAARSTKALGAPFEGDVWYTTYGVPAMDSLLFRDTDGNIIPNLATSWEVAPDGKSVTFKLRKGVKFHDGTDFNAEAVKVNLELAPRGTLRQRRESVDVIDEYTARLNLKQWDASLLLDLTMSNGMIASPTAIAKKTTPENQAKDHMVGTGPYKFVSWERDNYIKYERFDDYWGGKPYLDGLEFYFIADPVTSVMAFQSGAGQLIMRISAKDAKDLKAKGYEILSIPYGLKTLTSDGGNPNSPFANVKVREALSYAIDRKAVTEAIGLGYWHPVTQACFQKNSDAYLKDIEEREYDPVKAKKLLAEAGYPNGFETKLMSKAEENRDLLVAIQTYLAEVGIRAKLELVDRGRYVALHKDGWQNGVMYGTIGVDNAPATTNLRLLTSAMPYNKPAYHPPGFEDLYNKIMASYDLKKQRDMTQEIYRMVYDSAMITPLWVETQLAAQTKKVHDTYWCEIFFNTFDPSKAWLSK